MTKLKAFATHLGISLVIFIFLAGYIIYFWYPQPFFSTDGGWHGLRIIAAVDLVIGPVLTLIVYKPKKPGLKMDLTIIGLVQAAALSWGVWAVHYERPIAAVFAVNNFHTVTANDMKIKGFDEKKLKTFGKHTPVWIFSDLPTKTVELQKLYVESIQYGRGIYMLTDYYVPFDQKARKFVANNTMDVAAWIEKRPQFKPEYEAFVKEYAGQLDDIVLVPWNARYGRKIIALRKKDLSYVTTLNIVPPDAAEEKVKYVE